MSEELGRAELALGADLAPLDRDLAKAERRIAASVAVMQKMLDSLHADVDSRLKAADLLASRLASMPTGGETRIIQQPAGPATAASRNDIWGVRGPDHPGSMTNPLVVVIEAAKRTPMGSYAAAIGESDNASGPADGGGVATAADIAALTSAVQDLARNASDGTRLSRIGAVGMGEPDAAQRASVTLDDQDGAVLRDMANTLASIDRRAGRGESSTTVLLGQRGASGSSFVWASPGGHGSTTSTGGGPVIINPGGGGSSGGGGIPIIMTGGSGSGGGGDRNVHLYYHRDPNGDNGASTGILARLGLGAGTLGLAGAGTALSFAGLGFEHVLTTVLGVLGSAGAAAGGAGMLGLGALGQIGVGGGSDIAVMKSTITDTKSLATAITNVQTAQSNLTAAQKHANQVSAQYGKNSVQAQQANQQLATATTAAATAQQNYNNQVAALGGMTAGVQAELKLANATNALNKFWDKQTSGARVQAVNILMQAVQAGFTFVPMIAQAAEKNLAQINQSLKPLFSWLQGPQGIQIFNDLEHQFAKDLPSAIHLFDQAIELIVRTMDIAAPQTGGFVHSLDHLFTRLNSLDNATLGAEINKLIGDFRLWEHFIVLLGGDIYRLFHLDVGTGNSIVGALTHMLEKLKAYEQTAKGQAQIQNIFMVHKTEILELLHIFGELSTAFASVYMAVAPAAVTVMNDVVLPVLKAVASAIAAIAHSSPLAADALGALLIGAKFGGWGSVVSTLRGGTAFLTGRGLAGEAGGAAAGAAGGGAAAGVARGLPGLIERGALGLGGALEGAGAAGLGMGVVSAGGAIAGALPIIIPAVAAGVASYFALHALLGRGDVVSVGPGNITGRVAQPSLVGRGFRGGAAPSGMGFQAGDTLNIQKLGDFSGYSAHQLALLIEEIKKAGSIKVNGIGEAKDQVLQLAEAALKARDAWNSAFNTAWKAVNTFYRNTARTLPALYDDFNSNMKLIAHTMGLNSDQGRKLVAENVQKMVDALRSGMNSGNISVKAGMTALNSILHAGLSAGAITWRTQWTDMIDTVESLYAHHKISTQQYLSELGRITHTAFQNIKTDTVNAYRSQFDNLKHQYDDGIITAGQYHKRVHDLQTQANATQAQDMAAWVANLQGAMQASGKLTAQGAQIIAKELNDALGLFGAAKLPIPQAISWGNFQLSGGTGGSSIQGSGHGATAATGGLFQIGARGQGGADTVPMNVGGRQIVVGNGEQVAVFNRHQQPIMDAALSLLGYNGLQGMFDQVNTPNYMASGGLIPDPRISGSGGLASLVRSGLDKVVSAANAKLGLFGGGRASGPGGGFAVNVPGNVTSWLQQAMSIAGVSGPLWLPMLERQVMRESGGNPMAINLWDSNARAGHPSKGLLQTIDSTFAQYMLPGHGNIYNPIDNAIAAIRYMIATYGGGNPNVAAQVMWARGGGGYSRGGGVFGRLAHLQSIARRLLGGGTPDYFPVGLGNAALSGDLTGLTNQFQGYQTTFGNVGSLAGILQGLAPGTSLSSLGLTGAGLRASGLTHSQAGALIGGGPNSFGALMGIDQHEINQYRLEIIKLKQLYRDALHNHNKKLAAAILGQIGQVDQAMTQAISDKQQALIQKIQAKAGQFNNKSAAAGNSLSVLQGIEGLSAGANLSALGLSPKILKTLGLGGLNAGGLAGSSLSTFQSLASSQGGFLTASQLASAKSGVAAQNGLLQQEMSPLEKELSYYQSQLPGLHGQAKTDAISTMSQLAQNISQLQSSIDQNTQGLQGLTTATNANTNATAQMTGSISYSFGGNPYAPVSLASDSTLNLGIGG